MRAMTGMLLLGLAGCGGGGGAVVEASFAPGTAADRVAAAESGAAAPADSAGFRLEGLSPGPARLRLLRDGDTVGILRIAALPSGARLRMHDLRIDPATGLAFPRTIELDGARTVTLNGVRFAPPGRTPRRPDLAATVLGWSPGAGALLLRPADPALPDLRVLVLPATAVVDPAGAPADLSTLAEGDSVHLQGRREAPYVVASRLVVPSTPEPAARQDEPDDAIEEEPAAPPPAAAREREREREIDREVEREVGREVERDRGKGRGKGEERGRGQGRGKGKGRGN